MRLRFAWLLLPLAGGLGFLLAFAVMWPGAGAERGRADDRAGRLSAPGAMSVEVRLVHSRFCACCTKYAAYLRDHGVTVHQVTLEDMRDLKQGLGITRELESCHTMFVDGYFVEGHMPLEVIAMLLEQRPDLGGISLPGMPRGSPGMDGEQREPFVVYGVTGDVVTEFAVWPRPQPQPWGDDDVVLALEDAVCSLD